MVETNGMLKLGGDTSLYRELHRLEGILSLVNYQKQQLKSHNTSPQKEPQPEDEQKEDNVHNAGDFQEPQKGARSQPIEELSINSQGGKNNNNKTSVFSETSSVGRILDLEIKASKEQEELQARLTELKQKEIADLQEELARKARIA